MEQVKFTEEEQEQLKEAHAIRQRVRAARRQRQTEQDNYYSLEQKRKREEERIKAELAVKAKADFDNRIRKTLLELTYKMKENKVHLLADPLSPFGSQRIKAFTMVDPEGKQKATDIYWVYGKGFEWA